MVKCWCTPSNRGSKGWIDGGHLMIRLRLLSLCVAAGGILPLLAVKSSDDIPPKARALHFRSIVVDTHDDTTQRMLDPQFDLGVRHADGNVDIPRMREGGLDA